MPIITTKILGVNEADPKPATGFDYAGQPMKPGDHYNGRPEHQAFRRATALANLEKARGKRGPMSAERRKAFGDRMRAYWIARKAGEQPGT